VSPPRTLFDKLWDAHVVTARDDGAALLWIDRHFVHEGSHHAFARLAERGLGVAEPGLTFGVADHYVPTRNRAAGSPTRRSRAWSRRWSATPRRTASASSALPIRARASCTCSARSRA
jgi:homoaconitase/3-isopropylmalate dehydratase large subunit